MNFPEFPGSAVFLTLLYSLIGSPEFPGICRRFLERVFGVPKFAFSGEDEVDMLGSRDAAWAFALGMRLPLTQRIFWGYFFTLRVTFISQGYLKRPSENTLQNKHKSDIRKVMFTLRAR